MNDLMERKHKFIELFSGCGGMSLGLEAAGFELFMANELSPMAGETFAFNLIGENLQLLADRNSKSGKVLWIKSQYSDRDLRGRLRENPGDFNNGHYSDLNENTNFSGKLIIGDIDSLLNYVESNPKILRKLKQQNIDLLSGGPPCQGFSMAGKRIKDDHKNILPLSFAKFAGSIQPKVILLENVKGITSPFTTEDNVKHYAWLETAKAFSMEGFYPICMLVNSKYFGVPQNRPRFILMAFRDDIFKQLKRSKYQSDKVKQIIINSSSFYNKVHENRSDLNKIRLTDLPLYSIEKSRVLFNGELLPQLPKIRNDFIFVSDAIGDIASVEKEYFLNTIRNDYAINLTHLFRKKPFCSENKLLNHEYRKHNFKVKARFRLYQILSKSNGLRAEVMKIISGTNGEQDTIREVFDLLKEEKFLFLSPEGSEVLRPPENISSFKEYLRHIGSRKHSQRALRFDEPAPAQMTIPDDLCHYSPDQLRTLTVREMARIQSFPDWFVFRSKITTGGNQRNFEVPQYTQVGNAVPPLLAYELGKTIKRILKNTTK
ncbi:MAG: DNA cytosine methyltransferase [Veillonellaceae bacterium]|nr:DNA cytosine methyltransferase [Veillonellaceae bacterium]